MSIIFKLTPASRPNTVFIKYPSPVRRLRPSVRPQKVTSISVKFGM